MKSPSFANYDFKFCLVFLAQFCTARSSLAAEVELYIAGETGIIFDRHVYLVIICTAMRECFDSLVYHSLTSIQINKTTKLVSTCHMVAGHERTAALRLGSLRMMAHSSIYR